MIFESNSRRRWRFFLAIHILGAVVLLGIISGLTLSLFNQPKLPNPEELPLTESLDATELKLEPSTVTLNSERQNGPLPKGAIFQSSRPLRTAFLSQESQTSIADFREHSGDLDIVFPNIYEWSSPSTGLQKKVTPEFISATKESTVAIIPLISNADSAGIWHGKEFGSLLRNTKAAQKLIHDLTQDIAEQGWRGINIDFETLSVADKQAYAKWVADLAGAFHTKGLAVTVDVPLSDPAYDYAELGRTADALVVMAYDEHYPTGEPGPIASDQWLTDGVQKLCSIVPPSHLLLGLGAYCYDWDTTAGQPAKTLSFAEAMNLADSMDAGVDLDRASLNEHFEFKEPDGDSHEIWLQDAVSCWDHAWNTRNLNLGGFALWRLGLEDDGLWPTITSTPTHFHPKTLGRINKSDSVIVLGCGETYRVPKLAESGTRELEIEDNTIKYATYSKLPKFTTLEQYGHSDDRKVALTFDDGPDPRWTPEILKYLKENNVRASFFLVGNRVNMAPQIALREFQEGHLLGNHTFLHPHLGESTQFRLNAEMRLTQRAIEAATGHETTLFRAPFDTDTTPLSSSQLVPMAKITSEGYYVVGADLDSADTTNPGAAAMVKNVLSALKSTGGNIIVFHDFGTDRRSTIEAVKQLVPLLQGRGYQFVTLDDLFGVPRETLMPPSPTSESLYIIATKALSTISQHIWPALTGLLWIVSTVSILRIVLLGGLIFYSSRKDNRKPRQPFSSRVAVVIPAYNESKVIRRTINGVLASDYPHITVVVVDDGSTDGTAAIVQEVAAQDSRVRLLRKPNGGKSSALNFAFRSIQEEYVVTIDGDTIVSPDTIRHLVEPFADSSVDAVCGNVQVGNRGRLLTAFQDIEYIITQNYDRRAFEPINCITVVPGATGAWRRTSVLRVGGYSTDTLTEDADLTITLITHGGQIVYAPLGRSLTEAPETLSALYKQRFRWSYGMLQTMYKHRAQLGRATAGWIAIPNVLSQILLQHLIPICDLSLLWHLACGEWGGATSAYLVLLSFDLASCLVALYLDKRPLVSAWIVILQRFVYRPFLYAVAVSTLVAAFRGRRHGWNKLERIGSIPISKIKPPTAALMPLVSVEANHSNTYAE